MACRTRGSLMPRPAMVSVVVLFLAGLGLGGGARGERLEIPMVGPGNRIPAWARSRYEQRRDSPRDTSRRAKPTR